MPERGDNVPWYAVRDVPVYLYRINRRPRAQESLFSDGTVPPFLDHVTETLLMGEAVTTGSWSRGSLSEAAPWRVLG